MKYQFFTIAAQTPESGQEALNLFCGQQRVLSVEKHFVEQGLDSYWSICVTTFDGGKPAVHAITLPADSTAWRKRNLQIYPSLYIKVAG